MVVTLQEWMIEDLRGLTRLGRHGSNRFAMVGLVWRGIGWRGGQVPESTYPVRRNTAIRVAAMRALLGLDRNGNSHNGAA